MPIKFVFILVLASSVFTSCVTYQHQVFKARSILSSDPQKAAELIEKKANVEGVDQLVYLLEYGLALQVAKNYKESNRAFLRADRLADIKNYISLSKEAASLVLNQGQVQYKGDDFENIMISTMLAINFLMLGDLESALVEARRVNEKVQIFRREKKKSYPKSSFAVYLSAMIWEASKEWDNAYIAYQTAYKLDPKNPLLPQDLLRSSYRAQRWQSYQRWQRQFPETKMELPQENEGEVVLIFQQGWGPRKYPHFERYQIPELYPVPSQTQEASFQIGQQIFKTQKVYDVEEVAIKTLKEQYAALIAKRMAGLVVKQGVVDAVQKENETLGQALNLFVHATDIADLRQWSTLPQTFQIVRVRLPEGWYRSRAIGLNRFQQATEEEETFEFQVQPKKIKFLNWRSLK